jgi:hypothetical protein
VGGGNDESLSLQIDDDKKLLCIPEQIFHITMQGRHAHLTTTESLFLKTICLALSIASCFFIFRV